MGISRENLTLVLALKVGWLRHKRGLSLKEVSEKSGISISYLNEIEKGKKYPKADKIMALAEALDTPYDEIVSLQLDQQLMPLSNLLSTSVLQEIPFDLFGFQRSDLMDFMTKSPARFAAFVDTIIKIARNYDLTIEHILFGALRSYQELHNNYFPEIEQAAKSFKSSLNKKNKQVSYSDIHEILTNEYGYLIDESRLAETPELENFRSLFLPKKPQKMFVNSRLSREQQLFSLCRELGYEVLGMKERIPSSSYLKDATFDQLLNNIKASYFAGAIMLDLEELTHDIETWFSSEAWSNQFLDDIIRKYNVTPEMLFHRMTQIMAEKFKLDQFYFLRFNHNKKQNTYNLTKELHFSKLHSTHGIGSNEHYCRRWVTLRLLKELSDKPKTGRTYTIGVQRSEFYGTDNEYFCISIARPLNLNPDVNSCVTLGFLMDQRFKRKVGFWDDEYIPKSTVNRTCERCSISDCNERAEQPVVYHKNIQDERVSQKLSQLFAELTSE